MLANHIRLHLREHDDGQNKSYTWQSYEETETWSYFVADNREKPVNYLIRCRKLFCVVVGWQLILHEYTYVKLVLN